MILENQYASPSPKPMYLRATTAIGKKIKDSVFP